MGSMFGGGESSGSQVVATLAWHGHALRQVINGTGWQWSGLMWRGCRDTVDEQVVIRVRPKH
jgi:hypothetical protein